MAEGIDPSISDEAEHYVHEAKQIDERIADSNKNMEALTRSHRVLQEQSWQSEDKVRELIPGTMETLTTQAKERVEQGGAILRVADQTEFNTMQAAKAESRLNELDAANHYKANKEDYIALAKEEAEAQGHEIKGPTRSDNPDHPE